MLDKPAGPTSHDMVASVRRLLREKKVGHTGTLDPFATGVLPMALGQATKAIPFLDESVKRYRGTMRLGMTTDTQDSTGRILAERSWDGTSESALCDAAARFTGTLTQIPPMFSAVKQGGVPLYRLARKGEEVERASRQIDVHEIKIEVVDLPFITFSVICSRGTYVRTLAADIGEFLGCGACLTELRRLRSGPFAVEQAVTMEMLRDFQSIGSVAGRLITPLQALGHLRELQLTLTGAQKVSNGRAPGEDDFFDSLDVCSHPGELVRFSHDERLLAVAEVLASKEHLNVKTIRLLRVFS